MATTFSLKELEDDPRLFLYTSLTAGSSHIITATSRMETILKANRIPFQAIDTATDEKARRLWQRRAGQRKLPGLVKEGYVIGDLNEIEEWNEFGELKENIGPVPANNAAPPGGQVGVNIAPPSLPINPTATAGTTTIKQPPINKAPQPVFDKSKAIKLPGAEEIAARNKEKAVAASSSSSAVAPASTLEAINPETLTSSPEDKKESIEEAKEAASAKEAVAAKEETEPAAVEPESAAKEDKAVTEELEKTAEPSKDTEKTTETAAAKADETPSVKFAPEPKKEDAADVPVIAKENAESKPEPTPEKAVESEKAGAKEEEAKAEAPTTSTEDNEEDKPKTEIEPETEAATKSVAGLQVSEEEETQKQDPKEGEDAAKSVED